jgi:hypothetical protein
MKKQAAWHELFGKMRLEEIVADINRVWVDPDYELVIGIERVKKLEIISKRK